MISTTRGIVPEPRVSYKLADNMHLSWLMQWVVSRVATRNDGAQSGGAPTAPTRFGIPATPDGWINTWHCLSCQKQRTNKKQKQLIYVYIYIYIYIFLFIYIHIYIYTHGNYNTKAIPILGDKSQLTVLPDRIERLEKPAVLDALHFATNTLDN